MVATASEIPGYDIDSCSGRAPHTPRVTTDWTPAAVRAALMHARPDMVEDFEREFHTAMAEADDSFDLQGVEKMVRHWWMRAVHYLNPEAVEYTAGVVKRLATGDESHLAPKATR